MRPLHISQNTTHSECKPSSCISSFTHSLQAYLPLPAHLTPATNTFLQADTQSSPFLRSTCQTTSKYAKQAKHAKHAKPPQSTTPYHLSHALNPQKTLQIHTVLPIFERHSAHPSHHHPFRPLQTLQICNLHRPGFSLICQYTLDTSPVYLSLYVVVVWCTPSCSAHK